MMNMHSTHVPRQGGRYDDANYKAGEDDVEDSAADDNDDDSDDDDNEDHYNGDDVAGENG